MLREEGISAHGLVVDTDPVTAVRDALAQLEPPVDEIILATHPQQKSGWLRKNVVDRVRESAGNVPVEHVVVDMTAETGAKNVLVLANETVVGQALLDRIRERAARGNASFLIISPQSDPTQGEHPEAERRLRRALADLRGEGIDAHGQVAHPDPFSAALDAIGEERVDEIIVSTFAPSRSPWLRRTSCSVSTTRPSCPSSTSSSSRTRSRKELQPDVCTRRSASRPPGRESELAHQLLGARDAALHRVRDHAVRLVLHGVLLRPRRERGSVAATALRAARCSSQASTPRSSSPRASRCTGRCSR